MAQLKLIVADQDEKYIQRLAAYLRNHKEYSKLDVKYFSDKDALGEYIGAYHDIDVILSDHSFDEVVESGNQGLTLQLVNEIKDEINEESVIYKYQPIGKMMQEIINYYYARNKNIDKKSNQLKDMRMITCLSASGGTGKTVLASNLAASFASKGYRTLYLSLEMIPSTLLMFNSQQHTKPCPLFYYLKTKPNDLEDNLEELIMSDPHTGIHYFPILPSAEEMLELEPENLTKLIDVLAKVKLFDYVIFDLDTAIISKIESLFDRSNRILWVLNNDHFSFYKSRILCEELKRMYKNPNLTDHVMFILNRNINVGAKELEQYDLPIEHKLPYIPDWKNVVKPISLLKNTVFAKEISNLVTRLEREIL
ncbi:MinD-like ATPase involved in chromosome partitioning or flagellar assembly [Natronobacillus azotifigens]|uniref:AAA family ATPase n=1 Tax=Natronobacillus azotifigens TaxID=472978 RepID=A0A9J6RBR3_9BACI|nr:AAA family ATPase [Natronobacillus azotifigens]MCZ0703130.1 AAA family ATPase [Natronobacillus azotifigens]